MNKNIVISTKTLLTVLGILVLSYLLYQIKDVIIQLLISFILALAIEPTVRSIVQRKLPRWTAVGTVFLVLIVFIVFFVTLALPLVVEQTKRLIITFPTFLDSVIRAPELRGSLNEYLAQLSVSSGGVFTVTVGIFSNVLAVLSVFVFTLYMSLDLPNLKKRFLNLFSNDLRDYVDDTWREIELNLGRWVVGQLILMFVVGISSYVGLVALGMPYAVPLALISGILEVVPVLGPIISAVIATIVAFAISPLMGILVIALFVAIQQLENNILVPRVMQKVIGFNPLVTMIALLVGGKLYGVVGAILSIPVALILIIIFHRIISLDLD